MRKCKLLFGLAFAILTLCVLSIGASASTDSPYDVYVSDVPVTPENAADILGDGEKLGKGYEDHDSSAQSEGSRKKIAAEFLSEKHKRSSYAGCRTGNQSKYQCA